MPGFQGSRSHRRGGRNLCRDRWTFDEEEYQELIDKLDKIIELLEGWEPDTPTEPEDESGDS